MVSRAPCSTAQKQASAPKHLRGTSVRGVCSPNKSIQYNIVYAHCAQNCFQGTRILPGICPEQLQSSAGWNGTIPEGLVVPQLAGLLVASEHSYTQHKCSQGCRWNLGMLQKRLTVSQEVSQDTGSMGIWWQNGFCFFGLKDDGGLVGTMLTCKKPVLSTKVLCLHSRREADQQ